MRHLRDRTIKPPSISKRLFQDYETDDQFQTTPCKLKNQCPEVKCRFQYDAEACGGFKNCKKINCKRRHHPSRSIPSPKSKTKPTQNEKKQRSNKKPLTLLSNRLFISLRNPILTLNPISTTATFLPPLVWTHQHAANILTTQSAALDGRSIQKILKFLYQRPTSNLSFSQWEVYRLSKSLSNGTPKRVKKTFVEELLKKEER